MQAGRLRYFPVSMQAGRLRYFPVSMQAGRLRYFPVSMQAGRLRCFPVSMQAGRLRYTILVAGFLKKTCTPSQSATRDGLARLKQRGETCLTHPVHGPLGYADGVVWFKQEERVKLGGMKPRRRTGVCEFVCVCA